MRTGKESREEEEFGSKKTSSSSIHTVSVNTTNNDGRNNDKAKSVRSKHSVAEQRRRSKINERFQLLRDLIPNPDQKRDTASFLLEVIEHVQFLQEKVQKYEGSYQGWSSEPTKLMPWRNSRWCGQSFVDHPQAIKNDSGPVSTFSGKLDVNNMDISPSMIASALDPSEVDAIRDVATKAVDQQSELANKGMPLPDRGDNVLGQPVQSTECLISNDAPNQPDNLTIEGGTINISSVYSHGCVCMSSFIAFVIWFVSTTGI